jgi:hypothetical protein
MHRAPTPIGETAGKEEEMEHGLFNGSCGKHTIMV